MTTSKRWRCNDGVVASETCTATFMKWRQFKLAKHLGRGLVVSKEDRR